jgi:hypothetical protein
MVMQLQGTLSILAVPIKTPKKPCVIADHLVSLFVYATVHKNTTELFNYILECILGEYSSHENKLDDFRTSTTPLQEVICLLQASKPKTEFASVIL